MPTIFDNIENKLLPAMRKMLAVSLCADFCVGYFNLRGWKAIDDIVDGWQGGDGAQCRLLVGMQGLPEEDLRAELSVTRKEGGMDNATVSRLKKSLAEEFRRQLVFGAPTDEDHDGLQRLAGQLKTKKVAVKLFLRHRLHAKLYLLFRNDPASPAVGYVGSSNLTMPGLAAQGELNVDVLDQDAAQKLAQWFSDRWNDRWCVDITAELAEAIDESWARETPPPPYHIYIKTAYHLSEEAREGLADFRIPKEFGDKLFEFQEAAVKIAARHLNKRGGVLIGDVVGLGKTLMATALAKIMQDDLSLETLIICPKNLQTMWESYREEYRLIAKVMPITKATEALPSMRRYRVVLIDESHNLRNPDGKRWRAIHDYLRENESKCILLSATPYNKTYLDLSAQLRLFVDEKADLGARPERLIRSMGETEFMRQHQAPMRSLAAFEKSGYADDWRELMRLFMVRRTRSFIRDNYAKTGANGKKYLLLANGEPSYFPARIPKTIKISSANGEDPYARLHADKVVDAINGLKLPRYGLGNYENQNPSSPPTVDEARVLENLSRAGRRLMGFCRTNLFKRLESGGMVFLLSLQRHILRNYIFTHAIDNDLPLPIGTQDADLLDDNNDEDGALFGENTDDLRGEPFTRRAAKIYTAYKNDYASHFDWIRADLFTAGLARDLREDADNLLALLHGFGEWRPQDDSKLNALHELIAKTHAKEKVLIFSQFADTVRYLSDQLEKRGVLQLAGVTGGDKNPVSFAYRFSPVSNNQTISADDELRVLIATDVLSEGQNLQDATIVVNFDLPWAIIRLIQRAGRVDRIGQRAEKILCYSFMPQDGVEKLIKLRGRVRNRLKQNAEVIGTDEKFFEGDKHELELFKDLYNEKAGALDDADDGEVDLSSHALQIWKNAAKQNPQLEKIIPALPPVVFSTLARKPTKDAPAGVLVYTKTGEGNNALAWVDKNGGNVTCSQFEILKAAECAPDTPAVPLQNDHHKLVKEALAAVAEEEKSAGGALGRPSGARFRAYEKLKNYAENTRGTLLAQPTLPQTMEEVYRHPLRKTAAETLNRQMRAGISDEEFARLVCALRADGHLCIVHEETETAEPQIICSLGLADNGVE